MRHNHVFSPFTWLNSNALCICAPSPRVVRRMSAACEILWQLMQTPIVSGELRRPRTWWRSNGAVSPQRTQSRFGRPRSIASQLAQTMTPFRLMSADGFSSPQRAQAASFSDLSPSSCIECFPRSVCAQGIVGLEKGWANGRVRPQEKRYAVVLFSCCPQFY